MHLLHPFGFVALGDAPWLTGVKEPVGKFAKSGVSLPDKTMAKAKTRARRLGFQTFSAYIAALVQKDLHTPGGWLEIPPSREEKE